MNKVLIDTNIVIDLLAQRHPFYDSAAKLFSLADKNEIVLFISSLTIANTHYILSGLKSTNEAGEILRRFRLLVEIIPLTDKIIDLSLNDTNFKDFEDGLQYYSAIENSQSVIITRNLKDYKAAKLSVMTADEYLASIKK